MVYNFEKHINVYTISLIIKPMIDISSWNHELDNAKSIVCNAIVAAKVRHTHLVCTPMPELIYN
jgi:hypothetical protein